MHFNLSRSRLLLRPFAAAAAASPACSSYCLSLASNWPALAAACNIGRCRPGSWALGSSYWPAPALYPAPAIVAIVLHQRYIAAIVLHQRYIAAIVLHQRFWPAKVAIGRYWRRPRRARHRPICVASTAQQCHFCEAQTWHKGTKRAAGGRAWMRVPHSFRLPAGPGGPAISLPQHCNKPESGNGGHAVLLQCCCSAVAVLLRNWGIGVTRGLGLRNQGRG